MLLVTIALELHPNPLTMTSLMCMEGKRDFASLLPKLQRLTFSNLFRNTFWWVEHSCWVWIVPSVSSPMCLPNMAVALPALAMLSYNDMISCHCHSLSSVPISIRYLLVKWPSTYSLISHTSPSHSFNRGYCLYLMLLPSCSRHSWNGLFPTMKHI